ncbi:alpha/beta-hydrolase [Lentithecium fluviatile CBS 122367]|uniref:Alpha/beta-hydrolase n=1 Tax=Lentithecium fluviatile CBS 122367 TaxID=1168545 RepID=A0A6G1ITJ5_9PLEO|nr:alpha/beta-hydrolase [Lentithecium fluviatile CBS 122367]
MFPPHSISRFRVPPSHLSLYLIAGAASFSTLAILRTWRRSQALGSEKPAATPPPQATVLPQLSAEAVQQLPYPPDALPGARDVDSPCGTTRVYEWGPEDGRKVLLIHGISTPSIALADLAHRLVAKGYRVMLFDLFGRGYSAAPNPAIHRYDSALYGSQILICLQSSPIPWTSCTLVGYSLGGAIAADFTSYFPHLIEGLVLVACGGLIRTNHITWKSKLLYSTSGLLPEWLIERLVAKRLWSGPEVARTIEPEPDMEAENLNDDEAKGGLRSHAVYTSSRLCLLSGNSHSTVSNVVDWQILHHKGFVPAFISSIRYAPIHNQHHRWRIIAQDIQNGVGRLKEVRLVLGETDPIIIADELVEDVGKIFREQDVKVKIVPDAGHEVPIDRAEEIVSVVEEVHR